jgi:SNF2 family DNA or RNA helicase
VTPPRDGWPEGALYHSPLGLFGFQEWGIAEAYLRGSAAAIWDTGTGKSHLGMRLETLLVEDGLVDLALVVAEKGKIGEWVDDFERFTTLDVRLHHGPGRMKRLEKKGLPQVLVTTYETSKADIAKFVRPPGKRGTRIESGPLLDLLRPLRVLVIYDEFGKLRNRSSANYKAHAYLLKELRKVHPDTRVLGLTATPIEKDWEDAFNQFRLVRPDLMPTVGDFESYFVKYRDMYGRATYHPQRMHEFAEMCAPIIMRKRKTDPDVLAEFPKRTEQSRHFQMGDEQRKFYEMVEGLQYGEEEPVPGLWIVLRQIAGHPASIIHAARNPDGGKLAKMLVEELGEDYIRDIPSVKTDGLIEYLKPIINGQGAKVVVFTFFGQSLLPVLASALRKAKFKVYTNHGGMSVDEQTASRKAFKEDPDPAVFLTSDAGSRGINLPEATYVVEYESALTYANRTQRLDRIHRIDSTAVTCTCMTFLVDGTVEVPIINRVIERNKQHDILLGDDDAGEELMTAAERKEALQISLLSHRRSRK